MSGVFSSWLTERRNERSASCVRRSSCARWLNDAASVLISAGPAALLGLLFARVVEDRSGYEISATIAAHPGLGNVIIGIVAFAALLMVVHVVRQLRTGRREIERLKAMRDSYRQERESNLGE